jgi:hypothetical protein
MVQIQSLLSEDNDLNERNATKKTTIHQSHVWVFFVQLVVNKIFFGARIFCSTSKKPLEQQPKSSLKRVTPF